MDGRGKSDGPVLPGKPPNKAGKPAAEAAEGRGSAKGNPHERNVLRTQSREGAQSALERVRQAAEKDRRQRFTALLHHVYDIERLRAGYFALQRNAAAGVDGVLVFSRKDDARRALGVLPKRFGTYGLTLHPEKTRLADCRRPGLRGRSTSGGQSRSHGFDLLGFTHYWGKSRRGAWVVTRKTATNRFSGAFRQVSEWCRTNRHQPMAAQQEAL